MAQKKVVRKISKKVSNKKVARRSAYPKLRNAGAKKNVAKKITSKNILVKKTRKATKLLLYSLVIFVVSFILYGITNVDPLESVFGFIVIFSGAIVILGILSEIIFFFLKRVKKK